MLTALRDIARRAPLACPPDEPVARALATMRSRGIGSMIVVAPGGTPTGILTLRDVLDRIALEPGALQAPIARFMTPDPVTLDSRGSAYDAALAMIRRGVRHIVLVESGRLAGVVSERDLFGLQSAGVRHLSEAIRGAASLEAVEGFGRDIVTLARQLAVQGAATGPLTAFIAGLNDLLTERVVELEWRSAGVDPSGVCWVLMGSEGRSEQTLLTDQDNGIVFAPEPGHSPEATRSRLVPIARRINLALDRAGYRLCPGDIMAGNPKWCLGLDEWRARFARWIDSGSPEALLHGAIFFDLRPLAGAMALGHALRAWLIEHAPRNPRFLHQMAGNALHNRPPIGLLGALAPGADGRIDLKLHGAALFTDAARIMSLAAGIDATQTAARLRLFAEKVRVPADETEAWVAAFHHLQGLRLVRQSRCLAAGLPPDNRVAPDELDGFAREVLRLALEQARGVQRRLALDHGL